MGQRIDQSSRASRTLIPFACRFALYLPFLFAGASLRTGDASANLGLPEHREAYYVFYPADVLGQKSYPLGDQFAVSFSASFDVDASSVMYARVPVWGKLPLYYSVTITKSVSTGKVNDVVVEHAERLQAHVAKIMKDMFALPLKPSECALRGELLSTQRFAWQAIVLVYLWYVVIPCELMIGLRAAALSLRGVIRIRRSMCEECGYVLSDGSPKCSECGRDRESPL